MSELDNLSRNEMIQFERVIYSHPRDGVKYTGWALPCVTGCPRKCSFWTLMDNSCNVVLVCIQSLKFKQNFDRSWYSAAFFCGFVSSIFLNWFSNTFNLYFLIIIVIYSLYIPLARDIMH